MDNLWVEPFGHIIVARIRGIPSANTLNDCQERIIALIKDTGQGRILYDCLEMETPPIDVPMAQWKLDNEIATSLNLKRAVLVPNTKLAYLARIAFGEANVRVFYNDMGAAIAWLG